MLPRQNFTSSHAFKALALHYDQIKKYHLQDLFRDEARFERFSIRFGDILLDYSKNRINEETHKLLVDLAEESGLKEAIEAMFSGEKINETEDRAVLHTALRNPNRSGFILEGKDILTDIHLVLDKMEEFSARVISGEWKGYSGKPIEHKP